MKRLAEVTDAKQKAEEEAKRFREQLEKEAEAKRLLMENNKRIETKYKEIESMVQKVCLTNPKASNSDQSAAVANQPNNSHLIQVQDEQAAASLQSTVRGAHHANSKNKDANFLASTLHRTHVTFQERMHKHPDHIAQQQVRPGQQQLSGSFLTQPSAKSVQNTEGLFHDAGESLGTAHFGSMQAAIDESSQPRRSSPQPTDLLSPPRPHSGAPLPPKVPSAHPNIHQQSRQSGPSASSAAAPVRGSAAPTVQPQSPCPPGSSSLSRRERFLLPRRDGDSLERLEHSDNEDTTACVDNALVTRADYQQEMLLRAQRAKERLQAAEMRKIEERKQNMMGMFKDFREEVDNILSSYRDMDIEKLESTQRESIRKNLQSSIQQLQSQIHKPAKQAVVKHQQISSGEEDEPSGRVVRKQTTAARKIAKAPVQESESEDSEEVRAAKALASKKERLALIREQQRREVQLALEGNPTPAKRRLLKQQKHSSSSEESEEESKLHGKRPVPERAEHFKRQERLGLEMNMAQNTRNKNNQQGLGGTLQRGQAAPKQYLETSGEEEDDLRYTNTKQSSMGMSGTFGGPAFSAQQAQKSNSTKSRGVNSLDQKPKIRLVSSSSAQGNPQAHIDKAAAAPSIGEKNLDEMSEEQLLLVKEMIEQRIALGERESKFKGDRRLGQDRKKPIPIHTPQDVTIDDDFYDENFISLVYELNTGAS